VVRHGLFLRPFGATAHPKYFGELAQQAEAAGWEGVFLWDHLVYPDVP
jgi:alkanesulfonate monooxygenase SsuD/methylene tetrahydromethanopterin reductase-like flavin-dependent oxidoreductase (luciferase family)